MSNTPTTLEGAEFVLCYDTSPRIVRVDAASLQRVVDSERPDAYATGSHIIVYEIPAGSGPIQRS